MKMKQAKLRQGKIFVRGNWIFLLLTLLVAFGLKYHYSQARSDDLVWILGPTAVLVEQLSGIDFDKEAHTGYVNNEHRVIIAPACAGVNFFIIAFCMAVFCGIPVIRPLKDLLAGSRPHRGLSADTCGKRSANYFSYLFI
jgi:hypothetical protein